MHLKVVKDKFTSSCVTSDACNAHSSWLALEMRQNSGLSIYLLLLSCVFFFPIDEAIVQGTLLLTVFLLTCPSMRVCVCHAFARA